MPDAAPDTRSNLASATYTAIALVFFFGVGLAGGAAYRVYYGEGAPQLADRVTPPSPTAPSTPPQNFASRAPASPAQDASDLARIEPSAPPGLAPPPAPTQPRQPGPRAAVTQPPPAPAIADPAPQAPALQAAVQPSPPAAEPEHHAVAPTKVAAVPPKKPAMVAKTHRSAPQQDKEAQTVALHPPPTAPGNVAGPYRVQFGAFANEDNARRVQWAIEATGMKVDVSQAPGPSGHALFFLRSPAYPDYGAAISAAQTVQHRVDHFVNAIPIEYAILGDRTVPEQQAQR